MKNSIVVGALAFAGLLACPDRPPAPNVYKTSIQEIKPYLSAFLWIDEQAIENGNITRINICRGNNGLEHLTEDGMKEATAFTLLTGTLPEITPLLTEYVNHANNSDCQPEDIYCTRSSFHEILDDERFKELLCKAENKHNDYVTELVQIGVPSSPPNPELLHSIRISRMMTNNGYQQELPKGAFFLGVCE